jgi:hypothetical protein
MDHIKPPAIAREQLPNTPVVVDESAPSPDRTVRDFATGDTHRLDDDVDTRHLSLDTATNHMHVHAAAR